MSTTDPGNPQITPTPPAPLIPFWGDNGPPPVDPAQVMPTVDDVAALERTRTIDDTGAEQMTFGPDTRPSDVECQALIEQATDEVLARLPTNMAAIWYPAISVVIALRTAGMIEASYYREQSMAASSDGSAATWTNRYQAGLDALQRLIPPGPVLPLVA